MFKTILYKNCSGHNKIWDITKTSGGNYPQIAQPRGYGPGHNQRFTVN